MRRVAQVSRNEAKNGDKNQSNFDMFFLIFVADLCRWKVEIWTWRQKKREVARSSIIKDGNRNCIIAAVRRVAQVSRNKAKNNDTNQPNFGMFFLICVGDLCRWKVEIWTRRQQKREVA